MSQVLSLFERSVGDHEESGGALPAPPKEESLAGVPDSFSLSGIPTAQAELHPSCCAIFHTDPLAAASDRFRLLRMRLREHNKAGRLKTLLITSPLPHDGKSTIAVNLATALSEDSKYKVLVIEADLHRPC